MIGLGIDLAEMGKGYAELASTKARPQNRIARFFGIVPLAERVAFINGHDYSEVRRRTAEHNPELTEEMIDDAITELASTFVMCVTTDCRVELAPSALCDLAWHEMVMDTMPYRDFCEEAFGYFLHHIPYHPTMTEERRETVTQDSRTWATKLFGSDAALKMYPDGHRATCCSCGQPKRIVPKFLATCCQGGSACRGCFERIRRRLFA